MLGLKEVWNKSWFNEQKLDDTTHLANINPYRYRSYYYDKETNLYYLNSRYYSPIWGRFISADNIINSNKDIISHNLYAYCSNNPIVNFDATGFGLIKTIVNIGKTIVNACRVVKKEIEKLGTITLSKPTQQNNKNTNNNQSLPDYTESLNKVLIKNTAQASIMKQSVSAPSSLNYFYNKEKSGGEWDYKLRENWERNIDVPYLGVAEPFLYNGKVTTPEDFGNIHYGFVGTQMGYYPTVLYMGGGYAKCGISVRVFEPPYYCDDENNHEGIQRGINMYYNGE